MRNKTMEGKTIQYIEEGELDDSNALLLHMTDGSIFCIESGSSSGFGILNHGEIRKVPDEWRSKTI